LLVPLRPRDLRISIAVGRDQIGDPDREILSEASRVLAIGSKKPKEATSPGDVNPLRRTLSISGTVRVPRRFWFSIDGRPPLLFLGIAIPTALGPR
jgi:hypothetical protein